MPQKACRSINFHLQAPPIPLAKATSSSICEQTCSILNRTYGTSTYSNPYSLESFQIYKLLYTNTLIDCHHNINEVSPNGNVIAYVPVRARLAARLLFYFFPFPSCGNKVKTGNLMPAPLYLPHFRVSFLLALFGLWQQFLLFDFSTVFHFVCYLPSAKAVYLVRLPVYCLLLVAQYWRILLSLLRYDVPVYKKNIPGISL